MAIGFRYQGTVVRNSNEPVATIVIRLVTLVVLLLSLVIRLVTHVVLLVSLVIRLVKPVVCNSSEPPATPLHLPITCMPLTYEVGGPYQDDSSLQCGPTKMTLHFSVMLACMTHRSRVMLACFTHRLGVWPACMHACRKRCGRRCTTSNMRMRSTRSGCRPLQ